MRVTAIVFAPARRAHSTAAIVNGVRPLAEMPTTTSFLPGRFLRISRDRRSSASLHPLQPQRPTLFGRQPSRTEPSSDQRAETLADTPPHPAPQSCRWCQCPRRSACLRSASASAIQSIACAICGSARSTAAATFASSELMIRAISSADFVSRSADAGLGCSVASGIQLRARSLVHRAAPSASTDRIVKPRPYFPDRPIRGIRPGAVGQQRHRKLALGINPQRGAGEAE